MKPFVKIYEELITMRDTICPYALGINPMDLTCGLALKQDASLSWWKRIFRQVLTNRYNCSHYEAYLPCHRYDEYRKEK